jgi:MarR family transcriptional regulator, temperature-dependent positive regulator of motility
MFDHCLYFNTTALARQLEKEWVKAFEPFGLTPPQAFLLRAILDQPGLLQREFAQGMVISRPTATRALDGLMAKGLIERRSSGHDGREQSIFPTASAVSMHVSLNEASVQVGKRLKKMLGADVFADTVKKIRGVRSALK